MLNENIKQLRKAKGLSVPDSDMPIMLAEVIDTKGSILLGEKIEADADPDMNRQMADKLDVMKQEYTRAKETKRII